MTDLAARLAEARALVADLTAELTDIEAATALGPDDEHDPEGSTVGYERARVGGLLVSARRSVDALSDALRRRADGTYGRCSACGGPIGAERLEALPGTDRCVACAGRGGRR